MLKQITAATAVAATLAACATTYTATPRPSEGQTVRYVQGVATILEDGRIASVQVTPLGINEKGRLVFAVAVYNSGEKPFNFGVENVRLEAAGAPVRVFTYAELERMAKNDATTALVLTALAGGVAAAAAYSGPTSQSTTTSPWGTIQTTTTNYAAQAVAASAATATSAATMGAISENLDFTLVNLSNSILQTTTVDPDASYGGQVVGDRVEVPDTGLPTVFIVEVEGERFDFAFDFTKDQ